MRQRNNVQKMIVILFVTALIFLAGGLCDTKPNRVTYLDHGLVKNIDIWTENELREIEDSGKTGAVTAGDPKAFVRRIRTQYLMAEHPGKDALSKTRYYVQINTHLKIRELFIGFGLLALSTILSIIEMWRIERSGVQSAPRELTR